MPGSQRAAAPRCHRRAGSARPNRCRSGCGARNPAGPAPTRWRSARRAGVVALGRGPVRSHVAGKARARDAQSAGTRPSTKFAARNSSHANAAASAGARAPLLDHEEHATPGGMRASAWLRISGCDCVDTAPPAVAPRPRGVGTCGHRHVSATGRRPPRRHRDRRSRRASPGRGLPPARRTVLRARAARALGSCARRRSGAGDLRAALERARALRPRPRIHAFVPVRAGARARVDLLRAENARRRARNATRCGSDVDVDLDREIARPRRGRNRAARAPAARRSGEADRARVLRRAHLPRGRGAARAARRHREEPDPIRACCACGPRSSTRDRSTDDRTVRTRRDMDALLGAYALDALEPDEQAMVERHLADVPLARARSTSSARRRPPLAIAPRSDEPRARRSSGIASRRHDRMPRCAHRRARGRRSFPANRHARVMWRTSPSPRWPRRGDRRSGVGLNDRRPRSRRRARRGASTAPWRRRDSARDRDARRGRRHCAPSCCCPTAPASSQRGFRALTARTDLSTVGGHQTATGTAIASPPACSVRSDPASFQLATSARTSFAITVEAVRGSRALEADDPVATGTR